MRAQELFQNCIAFCENRGVSIPRFELYLLLEEFTGVSRARLPLEREKEISQTAEKRLMAALEGRCSGEPLQYLLGRWEFYGREFRVGPGVLIPRADTETLVEHALFYLQGLSAPKIADLCAGSGCVGVTLGLERSDAEVCLAELSEQAFFYLRENIRGLKAENCTAVREDVLSPARLPEGLDLIVSNPPYIPDGELGSLQREVRREPAMALSGGGDGLRFYRGIPSLWRAALRPGGMLAFEIGCGQEQEVKELLLQSGYEEVRFRQDLSGIIRVVSGIKKKENGEERKNAEI